ncbi:MAG: hypothetical protein ABIY55_22375 [Kofleriaceae bacterium]
MLVKFETFAGTGNLPTGWVNKGAGSATDWTRDTDDLSIPVDNNTHVAIFDTGSPRHAIDVGVQVVSVGGMPGEFQFLTALTDSNSDISQFFGCGMRLDNGTAGRRRELYIFDSDVVPPFFGLGSDSGDTPVAPRGYRLQAVMDGGGESCVIPQGGSDHRLADTRASRNNTFVGLKLNNVTVQFHYVALYKF